jgi:chromosome segregation ATPase
MNRLFKFGRILLLAVLAAAAVPAQTADSNTATMQALLSEVRQLRRTVEKTLSLSPRIQLILQRAQVQEQKVSRISQQLDEVRQQIAAQTARQTNFAERLAKVEQDISAETDAKRRAQLEDERGTLKRIVANGPDPQLRARESELANSLETEQAVLNEFNEKLDALERQIEPPPASDGQPPK